MQFIPRGTKTMITISILVSISVLTLGANPLYATYDGREPPQHRQVLLLVDHAMPELEREILDTSNDPGEIIRTKRIGSLSIVNSLDVLRQRVLLEQARRKALQDQRQIDANRRFLETIGKRSLSMYNADISKTADSRTRNGLEYTIEQQEKNHERNVPERILERMQGWLRMDEPIIRNGQDDQMRRVQAKELRLF